MGMVRPLPISNSLSAWFCVHDDGHPSTLLLISDSLSACCDQWIRELRWFQTLVLHFVTMNDSWTLPISDSCSAFCDNEWFHGLHWFPTLSFCMLRQWMIHGPCPAAVRLSFCRFHGLLCQFQTLVISAHLWQWMISWTALISGSLSFFLSFSEVFNCIVLSALWKLGFALSWYLTGHNWKLVFDVSFNLIVSCCSGSSKRMCRSRVQENPSPCSYWWSRCSRRLQPWLCYDAWTWLGRVAKAWSWCTDCFWWWPYGCHHGPLWGT